MHSDSLAHPPAGGAWNRLSARFSRQPSELGLLSPALFSSFPRLLAGTVRIWAGRPGQQARMAPLRPSVCSSVTHPLLCSAPLDARPLTLRVVPGPVLGVPVWDLNVGVV